ncbi:MAG: outer membrane protein assembly factor BamB family protein [Planctomycetota bacterium]
MKPVVRASVALWSAAVVGVAVGAFAPVTYGAPPSGIWPQWGGATRDFKLAAGALADEWPAEGPKRLWSRPLGEGYSSIVVDSERLYTMYRRGDDEVVVAMRADNGETVWEHRYRAKPHPKQTKAYGQGPNATPLILGDKIITIGFTGIMHCLNRDTGSPLWSHDLVKKFSSKVQYYGYANSPIAYKNTIIALVGGNGYGVIALNPDDGTVVWKSKPFDISYAAPVLINVDGQDQVVFFSPTQVIGLDPANGSYLWSHAVMNFCRTNCTSAIWGDDNLLWAATKGVGGTRVVKLTQRDGKTTVEEVWLNRKVRVYHWNSVRVGDYVYTSSGGSKPLLSVIDIKTGEVVDRKRGFGSTNGIYAGNKLILLDDGGKLALAEVAPEKINILSSAKVLDSLTWTPPTLVGTTLYIRDRQSIIALDLG